MKRKNIRCRAAGLCLFIIMAFLFSLPAAAQTPGIDLSRKASLTLGMVSLNSRQPIPGLSVTIYRVATFADSTGSAYTPTSEFAGSGVDVNDIGTSEKQEAVASKAMLYINANSITGSSCLSDTNGNAVFKNLALGLYLVRITSSDSSVQVASGLFFLSLPTNYGDGNWQYDVTAEPKSVFNTDGGKVVTEVHTVRKIWVDSNYINSRPSSIQVGLYRSGVLADTVKLSDINDWSYSWSGLSDNFTWTVKEIAVPAGYTASVKDTQTLTTITNTHDGPKGTDIPDGEVPLASFPPTGQNVLGMLICLAGGILLISFGGFEILLDRRKRQHE